MSPQRSNRDVLVAGTLRCLERLPPERVTARVIADETGANLASIAYHFGSKDRLVTTAVIAGLDAWLAEVDRALAGVGGDPGERMRRAASIFAATRAERAGLARAFVGALARAPHDEEVRVALADGFRRTRGAVARVLALDDDDTGALVLALFDGLLLQALLADDLVLEGDRLVVALGRLRAALPPR